MWIRRYNCTKTSMFIELFIHSNVNKNTEGVALVHKLKIFLQVSRPATDVLKNFQFHKNKKIEEVKILKCGCLSVAKWTEVYRFVIISMSQMK